jgi:homoserine kinase
MKNTFPPQGGSAPLPPPSCPAIKLWEHFYQRTLSLEERLRIAFEFEPHPDNLLPAFLGGFLVCAVGERVHYQRLDFPEELKVVVCIPDFELSTKKAREVLRQEGFFEGRSL